MAAKWAKIDDVEERLANTTSARGYTGDDIESRLLRAEKEVRAKLQSYIAPATLEIWTDTTVPEIVRSWVADLAAAFVLSDYYGEGLLDKTTHAGSLYGKVQKDLEDVRKGMLEVVTKAGETVSPATDVIKSDKASRTPTFTMTHPSDSDFGDGSLDEF